MEKIPVKHPYIKTDKKISQGSPVIVGTRTRIIDIIIEYEYLGKTPDQIIDAHPYLSLAQVHDALSYYYDHREEVDQEIVDRKDELKKLQKKHSQR